MNPITLKELLLHTTIRRTFMRAAQRVDNQLDGIVRVSEGKLKGSKAEIPQDTQDLYKAVSIAADTALVQASGVFHTSAKAEEKRIIELAQTLDLWPWAEQIRGFGPLSLGLLVGHAGDITRFRNPSALWKRMGLAVIDGVRQRQIAGRTPEATKLAIIHGYNPSRRSFMHVVSENMMKQNRGCYRATYEVRKAYRLDQAWTKGHAHMDALRYLAKRLLKHVWLVWHELPIDAAELAMVPAPKVKDEDAVVEAAEEVLAVVE